jgi:hypothetical protein
MASRLPPKLRSCDVCCTKDPRHGPPLQPFSLPFVAAEPPGGAGLSPSVGEPWSARAMAAGPPPWRLRVLLVCDLAREGWVDTARTRRLVDQARMVFDAAGVQCEVVEFSRLSSCDGGGCEAGPLGQSAGRPWQGEPQAPAGWSAAEGVLILLPGHWRRLSTVLQMMVERGIGQALPDAPANASLGRAADRPGRAYGLVVQRDPPRSLQARRALGEWLDWMALIDACEQARAAPVPGVSGMPPEDEAALEDETRTAAWAVVHAVAQVRAGRIDPARPLLARAWPR